MRPPGNSGWDSIDFHPETGWYVSQIHNEANFHEGEITMQNKSSAQEQSEELGMIIGRLAAMLGIVKEAFIRRKPLPDVDLIKKLHDLVEEIAFTTVREDEQMLGTPLRSRKPVFIYQSILTHLHIMITTSISLVDELQIQHRVKPCFSEAAFQQTGLLFTQQEMILCTLEETVRSGDEVHLRTVCRACSELSRICKQTASEHEQRIANGLCQPESALHFLTTLDLLLLLVHHEQATVKLLLRWTGKNRNCSRTASCPADAA